jgi:stearoyl-CoA desaturase (delta-9 desaturase)
MNDWIYFIIYCLVALHIRGVVHSLYLHRGIAHKMFTFSKTMHHVFRFLLWTNKLWWPQWNRHYAAQHRKHHKYSDTPDDPHSPYHYSFLQMFDYHHNEPGRPYYTTDDDVKNFAPNVPLFDDWIEKNIYAKFPKYGIIVQYVLILFLFGPIICLVSVPVLYFLLIEGYVIFGNWAVHKIGYRSRSAVNNADRSKNLFPIGLFFTGEELHANHHDWPGRSNFAIKWYEFDLGYWYARLFILLGLMKATDHTTVVYKGA